MFNPNYQRVLSAFIIRYLLVRPSHNHANQGVERLLQVGILISVFIFVLEFVGGLWTHSLALQSDAWHIFLDVWSFAISYFAFLLARRPVDHRRTYGRHRLEVV